MNFDKKNFLGKLNSDIDERLFSSERFRSDYSDAYNVLVLSAIDSGIGLVKGFKGTTEVPITYGYTSSTRKVVGKYADLQTRKIYFIIAHSDAPSSNDGIYELDVLSKTVEKVIKGAFLKLNNVMRITGINVIDGKYLLYTDGVNEPRNIDIARAKADELTTEQQILAIKQPPLLAPFGLISSTDSTFTGNNIRGNFFQFKYRYVYKDNTKSVFSPISAVTQMSAIFIPEVEQDVPFQDGNVISFTYNVNSDEVVSVELAVRSGNTGDFGIMDVIEAPSVGDNTYSFRNNNLLTPVDVAESNLEYDRIPLKALAQECVNGSNIVYGGITEGYTLPDVAITAGIYYTIPETKNFDTPSVVSEAGKYEFDYDFGYSMPPFAVHFDDGNVSITITMGGTYISNSAMRDAAYDQFLAFSPGLEPFMSKIGNNILRIASTYGNTISATSGDSSHVNATQDSTVGGNIKFLGDPLGSVIISTVLPKNTYFSVFINKGGAYHFYYYYSLEGETLGDCLYRLCLIINNANIGAFAYQVSLSPIEIKIYSTDTETLETHAKAVISPLELRLNLKNGDSYRYGVVYSDINGRLSTVGTNSDCDINVPFNLSAGYVNPSIFIFSRPPSWAYKYHIVRTRRRRIGKFIQFNMTNIVINGDRLEFNFNNALSNMPYYNEKYGAKLSYEYAVGDRVRFIKYSTGTYFPTAEDVPILGVNENGSLQIPFLQTIPCAAGDLEGLGGAVIEVYTPNSFSSVGIERELFYEIAFTGEIGDYGEETRYHIADATGISQSPTLSFPLELYLTDGDIWRKTTRLLDVDHTPGDFSLLESMYQSDKYPIAVSNIGRANAYDKDAKQVFRKSTIYHTDSYQVDSDVNNINRVYATSFKDYTQSFGAINLLYLDGFMLHIFQEKKVGQIPVSRQMVYNQDNSSSLILSSSILNDCRYFDYIGGINNNPESFCYNQFNKYFVDIENNAVCKIGGNGIIRISDIGMTSHFTEVFTSYKKTNPALASGQTPRFYSAWDEDNKLVIFAPETIIENPLDPIVTSAETIAFSEKQEGWSTKIEFKPTAIIGAFGELISWSPGTGKMWTHNTNETRNLFYGSQKTRSIEVPSSINPGSSQSFLSLIQEPAMLSDDRYDSIATGSSDDPSIWDVPTITTSLGQASNLLAEDFEKKEGIYFAGFYRDTTTPVTNPLLEGDALKGVWIKLKLTNSSSKDIGLNAIAIGSVPSKRTGV